MFIQLGKNIKVEIELHLRQIMQTMEMDILFRYLGTVSTINRSELHAVLNYD